LIRIEGELFDQKISKSEKIILKLKDRFIEFENRSFNLDEVEFSERIGNIPRKIYFPDETIFQTSENDILDNFLKNQSRDKTNNFVFNLESKLKYVLFTFIFSILSLYLVAFEFIPFGAEKIAFSLPQEIMKDTDKETLEQLDEYFLIESNLSKQRQKELKELFSLYYPEDLPELNLQFRGSSEIGANAFALPNGTIIFTDELIEKSIDDKELLSIFFHEIAHIKYRHSLQSMILNSTFVIFWTFITNDISGISTLITGLPILIINSKYSREFETEADEYAYNLMQKNSIEPHYFLDILNRISSNENNSTVLNYFSSHPNTHEREKTFQK
jgi:Zn-dependent protease with chaperone function